jgi:hypothetical protein
MPLTVVCTSCGARLRGPDNAAGRTFECPRCGKPVTATAITTEPPVGSVSTPLVASVGTPPFAPDPNAHVSTTSSAITSSPLDAAETLTNRKVLEREDTQPSTLGTDSLVIGFLALGCYGLSFLCFYLATQLHSRGLLLCAGLFFVAGLLLPLVGALRCENCWAQAVARWMWQGKSWNYHEMARRR